MRSKMDNGEGLVCPMADELENYMSTGRLAMQQIQRLEPRLTKIEDSTVHLRKLDKLEDISNTLTDMKSGLLSAALGKQQVPLSVVLLLIAAMSAVCILLLINNTDKSIDLGWNHFRIYNGQPDPAPAREPK